MRKNAHRGAYYQNAHEKNVHKRRLHKIAKKLTASPIVRADPKFLAPKSADNERPPKNVQTFLPSRRAYFNEFSLGQRETL